MFGFGKRRKVKNLEELINRWMYVSLIFVNKEEVKRDSEKLKIVLAYFFGTTDVAGQSYKLPKDIIMNTFLRCVAQHLTLATEDEIRNAKKILFSILKDMKYIEIMRTGIETLDRYLHEGNSTSPLMLNTLLISGTV